MSEKLKTPQTKDITGILNAIDTVDYNGTTFISLTVQDADDEIFTITCNPNYWKKVGKLYAVDNCVKVSAEQRIEGVTGYLPEGATEMLPHKSTSLQLERISRFSTISFQNNLAKKQISEGVEYISAVEVERASAVATFLSAFAKKQ